MIVYDAHAHAGSAEEIALRAQSKLLTVLSCGNIQQAAQVKALLERFDCLRMTAGVHPWYAGEQDIPSMLPYMQYAALVGEIGLDSVWCTTPMSAQRRAFSAQLDWAAANGRGVVLHTKGCEMEIARAVEGFPCPVVVHWYSGAQDALERFAAQDCYFTVGPDIAVNPSVQAVARIAADDRILFETDGMDAVRWALGDLPLARLPHVLLSSAKTAARLRGQPLQSLIQNANGNFCRLFSR
ncbi:MAG: TatD family hydrolase [Clostridia bacterium]|nr:TatD family hydrolase [Clostridia bacterium]